MPRLLCLALLSLLFAITAGQGLAAAQMADCPAPPPAHAGMHPADTAHCHTPAGTPEHAHGACCTACVNASLPPLQTPLLDRPARRVVLRSTDERYRGLFPAPPQRPPRHTA